MTTKRIKLLQTVEGSHQAYDDETKKMVKLQGKFVSGQTVEIEASWADKIVELGYAQYVTEE